MVNTCSPPLVAANAFHCLGDSFTNLIIFFENIVLITETKSVHLSNQNEDRKVQQKNKALSNVLLTQNYGCIERWSVFASALHIYG